MANNDEPRIQLGKYENGVLEIREGFKKLDDESMEGYEHVRKVVFPASLEKLEEDVFLETKELEELDFSRVTKLKEIPGNLVSCKTKITTFVIPQGVKEVGDGFLSEAKKGTKIFVPASVKQMGYINGNDDNDLEVYLFASGIDIDDFEADVNTLYVLPQDYANYAEKLKDRESEAKLREIPEELLNFYSNIVVTAAPTAQPTPVAQPAPAAVMSAPTPPPTQMSKPQMTKELNAEHDNDMYKTIIINQNTTNMMFSKEMEALIQATLEDGKLEENEKAALVKRAQKEGVDIDELEIYINSLLQKRQRELNKEKDAREEKYEQAKKEAFGRVCPNCGKQVPPLTLKCDCGYEFNKGERNSTMEILNKKLAEIEQWSKQSSEYSDDFDKRKMQAKIDAINTTPVPNTKEDIIEFLSMCLPNSKKKGGLWGTKSGRLVVLALVGVIAAIVVNIYMRIYDVYTNDEILGCSALCIICPIFFGGMIVHTIDNPTFKHNNMVDTWRMKFEQVMLKGRSLQGDPEFQRQLDYYENQLKK